jgi:hypothetical protein
MDPFQDADAFSQHLADQIPPFRPLLDEHLADNDGEVLPHVFMGDVARWFLQEATTSEASDWTRRLVELLDRALIYGSSDVRELVQASFIENLPTSRPGHPALARLSPALKADYLRYSGIGLNG